MRTPPTRLQNQRRRTDRARVFPDNTCPASRHVHLMADYLAAGQPYPMLAEEPDHCAESMLATCEALFKTRTALDALVRVCLDMDLENQAQRPTEAQYQRALRAAQKLRHILP